MKFILAKKQNMTQFFGEDGTVFAATVLIGLPMTAVLSRTMERDNYEATQFGYETKNKEALRKSLRGNLGDDLPGLAHYKEVGVQLNRGEVLDVTQFKRGDRIEVSGVTKGKGFQGVVKRHGFKGGSRTHGQKHSEREAGSIGGGARAGGRVGKGMRMPGRMGGDRITVKNLVVLDINEAENHILVKGAVPGRRGTLLEIRG